jgi:ribosomal protein RSM22 (predicted rRNA methylase)
MHVRQSANLHVLAAAHERHKLTLRPLPAFVTFAMDHINRIRRENGRDEAMHSRAENDEDILNTIKALQENANRALER